MNGGSILNIVFFLGGGEALPLERDNGKKIILTAFKWNEYSKGRPARSSEDTAEVGAVHGDAVNNVQTPSITDFLKLSDTPRR